MPYPPPPGPPDVGEFQAIGKLPAPQLPDVTGHGGEFLETDGIIPQWEPVSGVLPDQTGHAGEFLTTDGAVPSWMPLNALPDQTGHGGEFLTTDGAAASWAPGGTGVTTVGALTTPTANAATIVATTLSLAPADVSNPGVLTTGTQVIGGLKKFPSDAALVYDVRNYGAIPNDPTADFASAFYNAVAAASMDNSGLLYPLDLVGGIKTIIYVPAGAYYCSMPLCLPSNMELRGDGPNYTIFAPGNNGPNISNGNVNSFSGPVVFGSMVYKPTDPTTNLPVYGAPLVGATGQSLQLNDSTGVWARSNYWLDDSYVWGVWPGNTYTLTNFSIQFWMQTSDTPAANMSRGVIGSRGPPVWTLRGTESSDIGFGIYLTSDGVDLFLKAYLTTNPTYSTSLLQRPNGTLHTITSSAITAGVPVHVELDYNGSFFDFYVDGVNQGHVAVTGPIIRAPWEGVSLGGQGYHKIDPPALVDSFNGYIDSIRISNIGRHSGASSFTPPAAKYTWDANTMALYNWDQGPTTYQPVDASSNPVGPVLTMPFLVGQIRAATSTGGFQAPATDGPLPHYIRIGGPSNSADSVYRDFTVCGYQGCSGLITYNAPKCFIKNVWTTQTAAFGILVDTSSSFYTRLQDVRSQWSQGIGIQFFGVLERAIVGGAGIAVAMTGGERCSVVSSQPAYNSFANLVLFESQGVFSSAVIENMTYDTEVWTFTRQIAVGAVCQNYGSLTFIDNSWSAALSPSPPFMYFGLPLSSSATHIGDQFIANFEGSGGAAKSPCSAISFYNGNPTGKVILQNCTIQDTNLPPVPLSNVDGWLARIDGNGSTNLSGLSVSDTPGLNLAGTFTIAAGSTVGGPFFFHSEPDTNYVVNVTAMDFTGSTPAAGSTAVVRVLKRTNGFTVEIGADPGGTCEITFGWTTIRVDSGPVVNILAPSIPSSFANPFVDDAPNTAFSYGVTLVPAVGNTFGAVSGVNLESIISTGLPVSANSWELALMPSVLGPEITFGTVSTDMDSYVHDGVLYGLMNPGTHNVVVGWTGGSANFYIDGGIAPGGIIIRGPPGTQDTTVYVGQRSDTSKPLTVATLRHLKMDHKTSRCFSFEGDTGPGLMAHAAFIGDGWTMGVGCTGTPFGYAQQVINAKYGTYYYWMATLNNGRVTDNIGSTFQYGLVDDIWANWGGQASAPPLEAFVINAGWTDIWFQAGKTATEIFTKLQQLVEGVPAQSIWTPPTSTTTPSDQRAWALYAVPSTGTSSLTVNGRNFTITFNTDAATTTNDAVAQLLADGPTAALFLVYPQAGFPGPDPTHRTLVVQSKVAGTSGNAYVISTDGANNSVVYGSVGGIPTAALSVNLIGGVDNVVSIAGVNFVCNFDTDADTTVNNLIADIAGDPTASALVTGALSSHQMVLTAVTPGYAGNLISSRTVSAYNYPVRDVFRTVSGLNTGYLSGGANGAGQNGIGTIILCTVPPFRGVIPFDAAKEAQRVALNVSINAYVYTGVTIFDLDTLVADPGDSTAINPIYTGGGGFLNDAGHLAVYTALVALLP